MPVVRNRNRSRRTCRATSDRQLEVGHSVEPDTTKSVQRFLPRRVSPSEEGCARELHDAADQYWQPRTIPVHEGRRRTTGIELFAINGNLHGGLRNAPDLLAEDPS